MNAGRPPQRIKQNTGAGGGYWCKGKGGYQVDVRVCLKGVGGGLVGGGAVAGRVRKVEGGFDV